MTDSLAFRLDAVGRTSAGPPFLVSEQQVAAYAAAVHAPFASGSPAPPLFSVVPAYPLMFAAVDSVIPEAARGRTVHGGHEVEIRAAIRAGTVLVPRAEVTGLRATRSGALVTVVIDVDDLDGHCVARHRVMAIVRGVQPQQEIGAQPSGPVAEPASWAGQAVVSVAADHPACYAEATGDRNAVHLDDDAARAAGFDGVIAHGLGVFGLALSALIRRIAGGDADRARFARVRFGPPVQPGQALRLQWSGTEVVTFRALDAAGAPVLRSGALTLQ